MTTVTSRCSPAMNLNLSIDSTRNKIVCIQNKQMKLSAISVSTHFNCQTYPPCSVAMFKLSPSEGLALRALGLRRQTETKAMDVDE